MGRSDNPTYVYKSPTIAGKMSNLVNPHHEKMQSLRLFAENKRTGGAAENRLLALDFKNLDSVRVH